jgi:hypothetical protein
MDLKIRNLPSSELRPHAALFALDCANSFIQEYAKRDSGQSHAVVYSARNEQRYSAAVWWTKNRSVTVWFEMKE